MKRVQGWQVAMVAAALCFWVSFTFAGVLAGAADNAKIDGWAQDTSGTALAQAAVTLKPPSGAEKRTVSNAKGGFSFDGLAPGTYAITVDAPGFQKTRYTNITVTDGQTRQFDFTLWSGAVSETVEIDITRPLSFRRDSQPQLSADGLGGLALPTTGSGTISGRIRTGSGASAAGITVGVIAADSRFSGSFPQTVGFNTRADSLGFFRIENLPAGRYFVVAGSGSFAGGGGLIDRPVFFPGVADLSRAVSVSAGLGREETADFRLDDPLTLPVISTRQGVFRISGALINQGLVALPLSQPAWQQQPIAFRQLRVTLEPSAITILGGDVRPVVSNCRPPAQASFASAVDQDGRFNFSLSSGVYDLCVFGQGAVGARRGGAGSSSGGAAWGQVVGPFSLVVDRDIDSLLVDIGRR